VNVKLTRSVTIGKLIRIGSKNDCGYVIPADTSLNLLISFG
jgi:hypothetical protein